tara:strand:- start:185 stop:565 length:381 start_codon:yes stop_codon:yes gene_type:complete
MTKIRPYSTFLGVKVDMPPSGGTPLCTLEPSSKVAGTSSLHGGAIAALLETAAGALVELRLCDAGQDVQPTSITVDYMRPSRLVTTYANAEIVRIGDRIAHVDATAWQDDEARPVAMARLVFSLYR